MLPAGPLRPVPFGRLCVLGRTADGKQGSVAPLTGARRSGSDGTDLWRASALRTWI
jgi:hypothetical protein